MFCSDLSSNFFLSVERQNHLCGCVLLLFFHARPSAANRGFVMQMPARCNTFDILFHSSNEVGSGLKDIKGCKPSKLIAFEHVTCLNNIFTASYEGYPCATRAIQASNCTERVVISALGHIQTHESTKATLQESGYQSSGFIVAMATKAEIGRWVVLEQAVAATRFQAKAPSAKPVRS